MNGETFGNLDMYAFQYQLGTERQSNDKGSWYGWVVERTTDNLAFPQLVDQSKGARQAVSSKLITYNRAESQEVEAAEDNAL